MSLLAAWNEFQQVTVHEPLHQIQTAQLKGAYYAGAAATLLQLHSDANVFESLVIECHNFANADDELNNLH